MQPHDISFFAVEKADVRRAGKLSDHHGIVSQKSFAYGAVWPPL